MSGDQGTLERRRRLFAQFDAERSPMLVDLIDRLELPAPENVLTAPQQYLEALDVFTRDQVVEPDDKAWASG
jgi:hypothetical protein